MKILIRLIDPGPAPINTAGALTQTDFSLIDQNATTRGAAGNKFCLAPPGSKTKKATGSA